MHVGKPLQLRKCGIAILILLVPILLYGTLKSSKLSLSTTTAQNYLNDVKQRLSSWRIMGADSLNGTTRKQLKVENEMDLEHLDMKRKGDGEGNTGISNSLWRSYINPIKALLQKHKWKGAFLSEIYKGIPLNYEITKHVYVKIPMMNQTNTFTSDDTDKEGSPRYDIDCEKIFEADPEYLIQTELTDFKNDFFLSEQELIDSTQSCKQFIRNRSYIMNEISKEEVEFPIAYSIMIYKDMGQVEHLLKAIYRPQNYYCIHVDKKSHVDVHTSAKALSQCFDNVFLSSRSVSVYWGHYSVLEADLVCLEDLWDEAKRKKRSWKYYINLTGQEFPLKTNWELVQILRAYNGAAAIGTSSSSKWNHRFDTSYTYEVHNGTLYRDSTGNRTRVPHNLTLSKGPVHVAIPYNLADYVLHSKVSQDLLYWLRDAAIPDESFFSTLSTSSNVGVPASYTGSKNYQFPSFEPMVRFKKWSSWRPCRSSYEQREICIISLWDLPELKIRPEMFVNKFEADFQPWAYYCLEELHENKTREEMNLFKHGLKLTFDTRAYQQLPWVRNHL